MPFELELAIEQVQARVTADSLVEAYLEPQRLTVDLTAVYNIERAGVFNLQLDVPEGFEVRRVRGCEVNLAVAAPASAPPSRPGGMGGMGGFGGGMGGHGRRVLPSPSGGRAGVAPKAGQAKTCRRVQPFRPQPSGNDPFDDRPAVKPAADAPRTPDTPSAPAAPPTAPTAAGGRVARARLTRTRRSPSKSSRTIWRVRRRRASW